MPIALLIDTVILRRLISKVDFSYELAHLQFLVKGNYVILLAPEVLKKEWAKHREEEKAILVKSIRELEKDARIRKTIHDPGVPLLQEDIENLKGILLSQLETIDDLLANYSRSFGVTDDMVLKIYARQKQGLAPFKNPKKNNINDAELLFSSVEYLVKEGITSIFFVSDNTKEFADDADKSRKLHPEIIDSFPGFEFNYFTDIRDTYKFFDTLGLPRWKKPKEDGRRKIQNTIAIDRSKPLLDQVHQFLEKRFGDLIILPKKFIIEHYPFIVEEYFHYSHKPFTLITDNKELYDLLTSMQFEDGELAQQSKALLNGVDDEKKIEEIFSYLRQNYLHQIGYKNQTEVALSFPRISVTCDCSLCLYRNLKFPQLFQKDKSSIYDQGKTVQARLRTAYGFYKIRDFITAAKLMETLRQEVQEKESLLYYILSFNLYHLGGLISWSYSDDEQDALKLGKELQEIDLTEIYRRCRTPESADVLKWIHQKEFHHRTFSQMQGLVDQCRDLYYGQNSGFNESTRSLLEHFYVAEAFLNQNSIIYDIYSEFESMASLFIEGLLSSHAWNTTMGGRLSFFDDFLIEKLVLYSKAEIIRKFFYRFRLNELHYKNTESNRTSFIDSLQHLLNDYEQIKAQYESQTTVKNSSFWDELGDILYNGLTIAALVDIKDAETMENLAQTLLKFLEINKHFHAYRIYKPVVFFLSKKNEYLSSETIEAFFLHGIKNENVRRNEEYFRLLEDIYETRHINLHLTEEQFANVREHFLILADPDVTPPSWINLGVIYNSLADKSQKEEIQNHVIKDLVHHFKTYSYYYACLLGIVQPTLQLTNQYFSEIETLVKKGKQPQFFSRQEYYSDIRIDEFFNYCFKFGHNIPDSIAKHLPQLGDYYLWLMDTELFDYSRFDPKWLSHHFTVFYKRAFRKSLPLKAFLLNYIKHNNNTELERTFTVIYCYDD